MGGALRRQSRAILEAHWQDPRPWPRGRVLIGGCGTLVCRAEACFFAVCSSSRGQPSAVALLTSRENTATSALSCIIGSIEFTEQYALLFTSALAGIGARGIEFVNESLVAVETFVCAGVCSSEVK
jgi:hypothetical protein